MKRINLTVVNHRRCQLSTHIAARISEGLLSFMLLSFTLLGTPANANSQSKNMVHVKHARVCMVTNQVFAKDQIPVKVGDKLYYGCCHMCKKKLAENEDVRFGTDPVTRKKVDKSTAYIGAYSNGEVVYFLNKSNFEKYNGLTKP